MLTSWWWYSWKTQGLPQVSMPQLRCDIRFALRLLACVETDLLNVILWCFHKLFVSLIFKHTHTHTCLRLRMEVQSFCHVHDCRHVCKSMSIARQKQGEGLDCWQRVRSRASYGGAVDEGNAGVQNGQHLSEHQWRAEPLVPQHLEQPGWPGRSGHRPLSQTHEGTRRCHWTSVRSCYPRGTVSPGVSSPTRLPGSSSSWTPWQF